MISGLAVQKKAVRRMIINAKITNESAILNQYISEAYVIIIKLVGIKIIKRIADLVIVVLTKLFKILSSTSSCRELCEMHFPTFPL